MQRILRSNNGFTILIVFPIRESQSIMSKLTLPLVLAPLKSSTGRGESVCKLVRRSQGVLIKSRCSRGVNARWYRCWWAWNTGCFYFLVLTGVFSSSATVISRTKECHRCICRAKWLKVSRNVMNFPESSAISSLYGLKRILCLQFTTTISVHDVLWIHFWVSFKARYLSSKVSQQHPRSTGRIPYNNCTISVNCWPSTSSVYRRDFVANA